MFFRKRTWVPALGRWRSVSVYERLVRQFSLDDLPGVIAADLSCEPGMAVLDVGCGPGSLLQAVQASQSGARIVGFDPDAQMLAHARESVAGGGWVEGLAQGLPFRDRTFDRATMTLMLHHLTGEQKVQALAEARRVLRDGGRLFLTDWTAPVGFRRWTFLIVGLVDGFAQTEDNAKGRLGKMVREAGFTDLRELRRRNLWIGTIAHLTATSRSTP
jgi:ubiquinone/menaquinone biosynthesis C-methylase UbiE